MTRSEFEQMAVQMRTQMLKVAQAFFGSQDDAEDVAQEAMVQLWQYCEHIDGSRNVTGLAVRVAKNCCVSQHRKRQNKSAIPLTAKHSDSPQVEKPRVFDPRGQSGVDPRKPFCFDPCKVLTDGVIFILPDYFLAFIFLMLSPVSSIRCDECTILSSTASATAWSPIASYQFSTGSCDAITIVFLS